MVLVEVSISPHSAVAPVRLAVLVRTRCTRQALGHPGRGILATASANFWPLLIGSILIATFALRSSGRVCTGASGDPGQP
jgi:hypothetical protein